MCLRNVRKYSCGYTITTHFAVGHVAEQQFVVNDIFELMYRSRFNRGRSFPKTRTKYQPR